ncbi:spondin domain-containing protein [Haloglomus salinum]|uniref:spondin domain-containing protein n=1 Tax=Haloglomus salinum TaxID=2962673 RepID=UPI0020CA1A40|nr:spondin domain-containing protein [Haloglomus salinum]
MTDNDGGNDGRGDSGIGTSRRTFLLGAGAVGTSALAVGAGGSVLADTRFSVQPREALRVRIENVSTGTTLATTADGEAAEQPVPLSPGAFAVHSPDEPLFAHGAPERGNGLEEIAEDGMPGRLVESLSGRDSVTQAGAFTTPVGADGPGPLLPGDAYEFEVDVARGGPDNYLSAVTMFVPSNDAFYALGGASGLKLVDGDELVTGDVTDHVSFWDAGTEVNQEPGVGPHQVQRQRGAGVGDVEREVVAPMREVNGYDYPAIADVVRVTVERVEGDGESMGEGEGESMDGGNSDGMNDN